MKSRDPLSLDALHEIPDPARGLADRAPPLPVLPAIPSPTRADRRRRAALALLVAIAWLVISISRAGARPDLGAPGVLALLAGWVLVGAGALGFILMPRARGLPSGVRGLWLSLLSIPAIYLLGSLSGDDRTVVVASWDNVRSCLGLSAVMALGPLVAAALILQRSFASAPVLRGAAVGALCGLAGAVGVHVHCPVGFWSHVVLAHSPVIALAALSGGALGARWGRR